MLGEATEVLVSGASGCYSAGQTEILALRRGRLVISGVEGELGCRQQRGWLIYGGADRELRTAVWEAGV